MDTTTITKLAQAYIAHTGKAEATVSTYAMNDGKLLTRYRLGQSDITSRRARRTVDWFNANWPADLQWPADVPRPALAKQGDAA